MRTVNLTPGDEIRITAPSRSLAIVKGEQRRLAEQSLVQLGYSVSLAETALRHDEFFSNAAEVRIKDIHDAYQSPHIKAVMAGADGYNANQLLDGIDYELIKANPKRFIGHGDTSVLSLAIYAMTGVETCTGADYTSFGMKSPDEFTLQSFGTAVSGNSYPFLAEHYWSEDTWLIEEHSRTRRPSSGFRILSEGTGEGHALGGSLAALNSLQGTAYMPSLAGAVIWIEADEETHPFAFDRGLQSLLQQQGAGRIEGLILGRFPQETGMTDYALEQIIASKKELNGIPVIADVPFGKVRPSAVIPNGRTVFVKASGGQASIEFA